MELTARLLNSLTVYVGWLVAPIYFVFSITKIKCVPPMKRSDILEQSATTLARKIRNREVSSEEVVKVFIERVREVNPVVNAVVEDRFSAAVEEAKVVDQMIKSGQKSPGQIEQETPLLGLPITVKESCSLAGMSYSVGAKLRERLRAEKDGMAVANMRKAGAIPILVSNTPELCASLETTNALTGYTSNPYDRHRTPGGSSGGEAALVCSGASVLGMGSDFAGSIRVPCLFTGIFGHKPTAGVVPNKGHLPNSDDKEFTKLLNIGPMARYSEDLVLALKIMAGDNASKLRLDEQVNLNSLRIHYMESKGTMFSETSVDSEIKKAIVNGAEYFQNTYGCQIQKVHPKELNDSLEMCILQVADIENVAELINLKGEKESSAIGEFLKFVCHMSGYSVNTVITKLLISTLLFIPKYKKYKYSSIRSELQQSLKEMLGENGVLLFPTFAQPAYYRYQQLWKISSISYPMIINVLGFPATHVPVGLNRHKLPIGFQVIAAPHQDRLCLAVAAELEKAFGGWVPPPFQAS